MLKKIFILFFAACAISCPCYSQALIGEISKADFFKDNSPKIIDAQSKMPIDNALIVIPTEKLHAYTNASGNFNISPRGSGKLILAIEKEGYRPFSMTVSKAALNGNLILELEKIKPHELSLTRDLLHLGDNSYSENSANAGEITSVCCGPVYSKFFKVTKKPINKSYLFIGSIIGLDTIEARKMGQNKLVHNASSPMEVFINGNKIGELRINGDNQKVPIPKELINYPEQNVITLKTGINLNNLDYPDYDDVEIMNLLIDVD